MQTTLNKIKSHHPCLTGWEKLPTFLKKTKADDEPLQLSTILESNGIKDAIWSLRAVEGHDREIRLMMCDIADTVRHLMKDNRSTNAIDVARKYANGEASKKELIETENAAWEAAAAAGWEVAAARAAAYAAAWAVEAGSWAAVAVAVARAATAAVEAGSSWEQIETIFKKYI
jgi:hypothetical protein